MQANTRTIDPLELNSIKSKLSVAYLHGLNAYMNYAMQASDSDIDGLGIDFTVIDRVVGPGRSAASEGHTIYLQLKGTSLSSASMIEDHEDKIRYKLSKELIPVGTLYLVVVVLPKEEDMESWFEITEEELILRRCAYYLHVPETLTAGFVDIPKQNVLNFETFPKLFDAAKLEDQ